MKNLAELIANVRSSGATLALDDAGRLRVGGWRQLSTLDRERIRAYRDELIAHLRGEDDDGVSGVPEDDLHADEVSPATDGLTGIDAGDDVDPAPPVVDAAPTPRRLRVRWPGVSSRAEAEARMMVKALAGKGERHADVEPMFLFGMRKGECRLPVCAAHVQLRAHAEGRRLDIDALDADELTREYRLTKRWLEDLVGMLHRGELDQRTLLVRVGAIRPRDSTARLNF